MRAITTLFAAALFIGCEPQGDENPHFPPVEIVDLMIEPSLPNYRIVDFRAFAIFDDDSWMDVTADVEWSVLCVVEGEPTTTPGLPGRREMGECTQGLHMLGPGRYGLEGAQAVAEYQGHTATAWLIDPQIYYP